MTLPEGLQKMVKQRALTRRKEFLQQNCCTTDENEGINRTKLIDCLTKAKELINDYEALYSDDVNDPRIKPPFIQLNLSKRKYETKNDKLDKKNNNVDVIELYNYLKTTCEYIAEYEKSLKELGYEDFD